MKKIMFNDKYGLTEAVLEGRKTMTRRIAKFDEKPCNSYGCVYCKYRDHDRGCEWILEHCRFKPGEIVAVAQSYHCLNKSGYVAPEWLDHYCEDSAGYENKMFVRADLMPHQICITNVRVERLQDISEDDVYREGFAKQTVNDGWGNASFHWEAMLVYYDSLGRTKELRSPNARDAFATLIDKVSGNGTWDRNPWVFVYEFELI